MLTHVTEGTTMGQYNYKIDFHLGSHNLVRAQNRRARVMPGE